MKCGSTRPVAILRSASTKRRSSLTGVPRVAVRPRSTWAASSRAKWFSTRTFSSTQGSPTSSASSSPSFGRCRPVATSTVIGPERDAGGDHGLDHRPQEQPVGHRPRDVADQDAGALPAARQVGKRRRADRLLEGLPDRRAFVGEAAERDLAQHGDVGGARRVERQMAPTESEWDPVVHGKAPSLAGYTRGRRRRTLARRVLRHRHVAFRRGERSLRRRCV